MGVIEELDLPAPWTDLLDDLHALKRIGGSRSESVSLVRRDICSEQRDLPAPGADLIALETL